MLVVDRSEKSGHASIPERTYIYLEKLRTPLLKQVFISFWILNDEADRFQRRHAVEELVVPAGAGCGCVECGRAAASFQARSREEGADIPPCDRGRARCKLKFPVLT